MQSNTMQDLEVVLREPGKLAHPTEVIAAERINIEGGTSFRCGGEHIFHALFKSEEDATAAKHALEKSGNKVREQRAVTVVQVEDKPGEAAKIYRIIADQGINLDFTYLATNTRMVIGSQDSETVSKLLRSLTTAGARR